MKWDYYEFLPIPSFLTMCVYVVSFGRFSKLKYLKCAFFNMGGDSYVLYKQVKNIDSDSHRQRCRSEGLETETAAPAFHYRSHNTLIVGIRLCFFSIKLMFLILSTHYMFPFVS